MTRISMRSVPKGTPIPKTKTKYNSVKSGGYHSRFEAQVAAELQLLERAGKISELKEQQRYKFYVHGKLITSSIMDFTYIDEDGNKVWYEAKGFPTAIWKMKHKLIQAALPVENPGDQYFVHWQNGKVERFV